MTSTVLKTIIVAISLTLASASSAAETPAWVVEGSKVDKWNVTGVGIGESRAQAVALALAEIAKLKQVRARTGGSSEPEASAVIKTETKDQFGPVSVTQAIEQGSLKDKPKAEDKRKQADDAFNALEAEDSGQGDDARFVTAVTRIGLTSPKGFYALETRMDSVSGLKSADKEDSRLVVKSEGLGFSDVVTELVRQGMKMQTYEDADGVHYVSLQARLPQAK
ncbi:MAG: hypothetical protein WC943_15805 [Elusimicrobiota bacterium]|jgi:hypothetical protein